VKEVFQNKFYREPFVSFIELGHFGFFDAYIIMWDTIEEYGLDGCI
jgi:hypothetical protein